MVYWWVEREKVKKSLCMLLRTESKAALFFFILIYLSKTFRVQIPHPAVFNIVLLN